MARKPKKLSSQGERRKLYEECVMLATRIAKIRDGDKCVMCGCYVSGANAHGSHIIPRSADKYLALHPVNILQMCMHCHLYVWHKNPIEVSEWLEKKDADRVEWLRHQRIRNKTLGPMTALWLNRWKDVLNGAVGMDNEYQKEWDSMWIEQGNHDWVIWDA